MKGNEILAKHKHRPNWGLMSLNCIFKYGSTNVKTIPLQSEDLEALCFLAIRVSVSSSNKTMSETKWCGFQIK